jgi:hypothetical protein
VYEAIARHSPFEERRLADLGRLAEAINVKDASQDGDLGIAGACRCAHRIYLFLNDYQGSV